LPDGTLDSSFGFGGRFVEFYGSLYGFSITGDGNYAVGGTVAIYSGTTFVSSAPSVVGIFK
jgi:hypothetical protein